jgi:hypothetical protein
MYAPSLKSGKKLERKQWMHSSFRFFLPTLSFHILVAVSDVPLEEDSSGRVRDGGIA